MSRFMNKYLLKNFKHLWVFNSIWTAQKFSYKPVIILNTGRSCYKSALSLDKLYSNGEERLTKQNFPSDQSSGKFGGYIPLEKLKISFSKSSGPGGQNVNKVNTKVEIRFHLDTAEWIPQTTREKLKQVYYRRINKAGEFIVVSERTKSQLLNTGDCLDKIRSAVRELEKMETELSPEKQAAIAARLEKKKRETLKQKRLRSMTKEHRRTPVI